MSIAFVLHSFFIILGSGNLDGFFFCCAGWFDCIFCVSCPPECADTVSVVYPLDITQIGQKVRH